MKTVLMDTVHLHIKSQWLGTLYGTAATGESQSKGLACCSRYADTRVCHLPALKFEPSSVIDLVVAYLFTIKSVIVVC